MPVFYRQSHCAQDCPREWDNSFSKTFTKQNFASLIPDRYLTHSILEGMVFDDEKTSNSKNIILAASVSIPMTDLYIPFSIIITPDGK